MLSSHSAELRLCPAPAAASAFGHPKLLLYSHDTFGLGNIRRTLLVAQALGEEFPTAATLIVTGSPMIHAFRLPPRVDYVKLPCLDRVGEERYAPAYLAASAVEVASIRRTVLEKTVLGFAPDFMLVDKKPAGVDGELLDTLKALHRLAHPPRLVLGIRDILDEPVRTRESLRRNRVMQTIDRYYDEVWIYGDPSLFDAVTAYRFPAPVARKTLFCGYLRRELVRATRNGGPPHVLVTTGGGADGVDVIESYLEGLVGLPRRIALRTTVVFGSQMAASARTQLLKRYGHLTDVQFLEFEPDLSQRYAAADVVVSMAGYSTVCELLSFGCRAVLVPRANPVSEQLLRARLLADRGMFELVEPDALTPALLLQTVLKTLERSSTRQPLDTNGLSRIRERARALLDPSDA